MDPEVIFIQETLGEILVVRSDLQQLLGGWSFIALDAKGRSGGLVIEW